MFTRVHLHLVWRTVQSDRVQSDVQKDLHSAVRRHCDRVQAVGDILDLAANVGIVQKSGAWFAYNENKIGQGRENAKLFLREHPEIRDEIEKKVRVHYHLDPADETAEAAVQAEDTEKEE